MKILWLLPMLLVPALAFAAEKAPLSDPMDRINYSLGYQIGGDLKDQKIDLRDALLLQGLKDAMQGTAPAMSKAEMRSTLVELKQKVLEAQAVKQEAYRAEGRDFLAANAEKEGVVVLPSGLQYQVLVAGKGKKPSATDRVRVNYRGTRLDGQEFDSSYRDGKPAEFALNQVIPGWQEGLQLMPEGSKWKLFIPADLAFGEKGPLADQTVIFEVELLKVL